MHFDLADLNLFIHVAEASSLTGGAKQAHLSTAAASTRIKSFEGQLGSRLFYRGSHGVDPSWREPTQACSCYYAAGRVSKKRFF